MLLILLKLLTLLWETDAVLDGIVGSELELLSEYVNE